MEYKNIVRTEEEKNRARTAGKLSVEIHQKILEQVELGNTPAELNKLAESLLNEYSVKPSFKGVPGPISEFPGNLCVSVNEETLHTIPFSKRAFESGDIIKIDFGIIYEGFFTDHCITVGLGELNQDENKLIETGKRCIDSAISQATIGNRIGDISNQLESVAKKANANYVTNYAGHGIGSELWMEPQIPSFGKKNRGEILQEGMIFCVENQITYGDARLDMLDDGWTLVTRDGSKSVMFEHMVLILDSGTEVLTSYE